MTAETAPAVLVRFEIAALGHGWHDEVTVTRTPLVDALIGRGALTLLEAGDAEDQAVEDDGEAPGGQEPVGPVAPATDAVSWFGPETTPAG